MDSSKMNIEHAYDEYQYFIVKYLLPLMGISNNNNLEKVPSPQEPCNPNGNAKNIVRQEDNVIYFSSQLRDLFFLKWKPKLAEDCLSLARSVIRAFWRVSQYTIVGNPKSKKIDYKSDMFREENYKLAVQKGICDWCAGSENPSFYQLIQILEQWSVQTYEGKKVTFGFIYDPQAKSNFSSNQYGSWLDFLKDDYAATLTDCIHSVIRLDKNCDFSEYLSLTENDKVESYHLSPLLPYRFAPIIEKYVTGSCVGIFLLNNGDILISKNQAVQLIKRNLKWLNLSYETFFNMIESYMPEETISKELIKQIYASVLDVSFAHTGGIIAVTPNFSNLTTPTSTQEPILNKCDDLLDLRELSKIAREMQRDASQKISDSEIKKRMLKRKTMLNLVAGREFSNIDRKLRAELISMDGACILNLDGHVCSAGAIIRNDSGSSGGGRSAAARKLSSNGGMAVKVSTDGYIELFIDYSHIYAIK